MCFECIWEHWYEALYQCLNWRSQFFVFRQAVLILSSEHSNLEAELKFTLNLQKNRYYPPTLFQCSAWVHSWPRRCRHYLIQLPEMSLKQKVSALQKLGKRVIVYSKDSVANRNVERQLSPNAFYSLEAMLCFETALFSNNFWKMRSKRYLKSVNWSILTSMWHHPYCN